MQQVGALGLSIFRGVEESLVVGRPLDRTHAFRRVGKHLAGAQIFHMQLVLAKAHGVGGVGHQFGVVADRHVAQRKKLLAFRHLVRVQHHFLRRVERAFLAAQHAVLLALFGARVVPVAVLAKGNAVVGLLDVAQRLVVQLLGQRLLTGGRTFSVSIFRFEILVNFGARPLAQPRVVVHQHDTVHRSFGMNLFRNWGNGRLGSKRTRQTNAGQSEQKDISHERILTH